MKKILLILIGICAAQTITSAQTTITTAGSSNIGYDGTNYVDGNAAVSFAVQNTNNYSIILKGLQTIQSPVTPNFPANPGRFYLWYSATSLSDTTTISTSNWSIVDSATNNSLVTGYNTIFSSLNFTIPANTTYRFALQSLSGIAFSGGYPFISGPGATPSSASPSILSANGVNLMMGDSKIAGQNIGVTGYFPSLLTNLAWFTGSITFESSIPCTSPPVAGNTISSTNPVCNGVPFTLTTAANTGVNGQTYQWQSSQNGTNWTNITNANASFLTTSQATSNYYRCRVTCSGNTSNSTPVQVTTPSGVSGTFTINKSALTGGNNFASFIDAINYVSCGISGPVIFNVVPNSGPYKEQIAIPFIGGTSNTNTITINGNGEMLSYNFATTTNRAVLTLNDADHIIIDSLTIDCSSGNYGWGVLFTNNADSNVIRKCRIITDTNSAIISNFIGIAFNGSASLSSGGSQSGTFGSNGSYNLVESNTINGGEYGIYVYGGGINNNNNKIVNNYIKNFYRWGIYAAYQNQNLLISKNEITRPTRNNSYTSIGGGIWLSTGCENVLVEKNKIHNLHDAMINSAATCDGIFISASASNGKENKAINNLIYNMNGIGSQFGITINGNYAKVYHNTIILDDATNSANESFGLWSLGSIYTTGLSFMNNVVYNTRNGSGQRRCISMGSTVNASQITSNHNVFYINCPNSSDANIADLNYVKFSTLADWKTANNNSYDQQSVSIDPAFLNNANFDYTPSAPQINNIGAYLNITSDITNSSRGIYPDPGAYEFTSASCNNPSSAGTAIASKTDVCLGNTFSLDLLGNSFGEGISYQWQTSTNNSNWANFGTASPNLQLSVTPNASNFYRCAVQCGAGAVAYSTSVQVTTGVLMSGTYTINSNIPTSSTNFQSFSDAINAIRCGINGPVVFNVTSNNLSYNEQVVIPSIAGSSATNTITINGNGNTIYYTSNNQQKPAVLVLDGADHIIIDSLIIDPSSGNYGWGIVLMHQADSNIVRRCTVIARTDKQSSSAMGILIAGSLTNTGAYGNNGNYNLITDNTVIGGYQSIYIFGNPSSTTQNIHNIIKRNKLQDMYSAGVYAYAQSAGLEISENDISRPTRINSASAMVGIYLYPGCFGAILEKNKIHNLFDAMQNSTAGGYGFFISTTPPIGQENKLINNLIYNLGGSGNQYGFYCGSSPNLRIYHNTFISDDVNANSGDIYGAYQSTSSGLDFRNNLIYITHTGGTNRCFSFADTALTSRCNNNILYCPNGNIGRVRNIDYTTLANWRAANNNKYDSLSISIDPVFTNMGVYDYTPTATTADNIGAALGVTTDIVGITRSIGKPDAGAFEFGSILPTNALHLKGERNGTTNKLIWSTSTENNNLGFELQRSTNSNNSDFKMISFIASKAINGNSNNPLTYSFEDATTTKDSYYKLKQIDKDGKFSFSNTVLIKAVKSTGIQITSMYPNPATDKLNINISSSTYNTSTITIIDVYGKTIIQQNINLLVGDNTATIYVKNLSTGNYVIKLSCENGGEPVIKKFVKL